MRGRTHRGDIYPRDPDGDSPRIPAGDARRRPVAVGGGVGVSNADFHFHLAGGAFLGASAKGTHTE
ncbi:hypothetical protein C461_05939 [Halorubrum aidingense JCM 13560]|uniref:Uncharacterized protein n=1 Tax=Halorubrum aidingense JCM 13560 TaxID=1230454 RepID=M0PDT8_9EURY|nr:hypothetical protein C461_05939 [Halorubrum aidingense JCM 13560]